MDIHTGMIPTKPTIPTSPATIPTFTYPQYPQYPQYPKYPRVLPQMAELELVFRIAACVMACVDRLEGQLLS